MIAVLQDEIFTDEAKAREWLEARVWANGVNCPHCGNTDADKITKLEGKAHRPGLYQCNECREQFTVTVGTVFERSKIPLTKWLAALFLMTASKKGVSAHQVHRMLKISYKSTWFMMHRLREAMRIGGFMVPQMGGGGVVEIDETFIGKTAEAPKGRKKPGRAEREHVNTVLSLVERGGSVRSFHIDSASVYSTLPIIRENIKRDATVNTDQAAYYKVLGKHFDEHHAVDHSAEEYVRKEMMMIEGKEYVVNTITTNTVEGYFSIFKRGMKGVYQHCSEKHLHRYLAEFDFRYSNRAALGVNDEDRAALLAKGIKGKRLTYRRPRGAELPHQG